MVYIGPHYGHKNVAVYIILCSSIGSLTVMSCKGLGLAIKETLTGEWKLSPCITDIITVRPIFVSVTLFT